MIPGESIAVLRLPLMNAKLAGKRKCKGGCCRWDMPSRIADCVTKTNKKKLNSN